MIAGEIWLCDLGKENDINRFSSEQYGIRPVIILSNEICCKRSPVVQIVPLTSRNKNNMITHYMIYKSDYKFLSCETNTVLCEQIKTISKRRLKYCLGEIKKDDLNNVIKTVMKNF